MATKTPRELWNQLMGTDGVYEVILPFILIFAIVYGLLSKLGIFGSGEGDTGDKVNALIALVVAAFALFTDLVPEFMTAFTGQFALFLILVLVVLIAGALAGYTPGGKFGKNYATLIGVVAIGGVALLIWMEGGIEAVYGSQQLPAIPFIGSIDLATALIILLAIGAIYYLVS